jgi:hypothetical protein
LTAQITPICTVAGLSELDGTETQNGGSREVGMSSPPEGALRNAVAWFAARGVAVERVLSDNGSRLTNVPGR